MAYPARLEVATLLAGSEGVADEGCLSAAAADASCSLPPVVDTSKTGGTPSPLYVIGDASKRSKSAGVGLSGRVLPLGLGSNIRPNGQTTTTHLSVSSSRPRSSPYIGRRHTRVTPLPCTVLQSTLSHDAEESCTASQTPSKSAKWGREKGKVSHSKNASLENGETVPWPSSSLDSEGMEQRTSTPIQGSSSIALESKSPWSSGSSPWTGGATYPVPTINIASEQSTPATHKKWRYHCHSSASERSEINTPLEHSRYVTEKIHNLVTAFSQRASRVKAQITQPPTPSTELSDGGEEQQKPRHRLESIAGEASRSPTPTDLVGVSSRKVWFLRKARACKKALTQLGGLEPQSTLYISWLFIVSVIFFFNAWVIPLRSVFSEYQNADNLAYWLAADYLCDFIYVLDIVLKSRVKYIDNGFWVGTPSLMRKHYMASKNFIFDVAALLPLDLLYIQFGPISVFRLPRILKIHTFWEFFNRLDSVLSSPHAVRVVRTVLNMLYLIHLNTCTYYGFSKVEGIGSNKWVFQGNGNAYIRCFYFATKTATSIGKNPKPENEAEYLFMTCSWLMGVFVFALLIGQIRDIVATATRNQNEYRAVMDQTQAYLHRLNLPPLLQERVRQWFTYTWQNQKTLDEMKCLKSLPRKMRTDLAINVHIQTLSKVQLFQDCDNALLRDLVLKLMPVLYLPGDYVCKKGEVGKEMYIVQTGQVMVMGGEKGDVVLATLGEGSVFGEISLLALAGGNRRTANVRSRGFSNLFVLSKADLQATIKDYPEAQEILKKKAKKLIRQNQALEQKETQDDDNVIIKSRESTPKLLHTVLRVVRPDSYTASLIRRSSRTISRSTMDIPSTASFSPGGVWSWTPSPRLQCSSASLEVPTKSSRRSSLEVPSNASRAPIAKTSMSESLPEEDEEEFLVVETSELYEGGGEAYPPGSPASQHSISLHRRSRSTTPQSVFSHASPPSGAPSPTDYFYSEQGGTSACEPYRPQSSSYSFTEHCVGSPILERKMSFETKSANISLKSSSSLSRYSTATLTRQLCVTKHEDEPSLSLSTGCEASVPLSHEAQFIRGHLESDIATFGEINNVSSTVNSSNCSISNNQKEQSSNNQQSHHGMRSSSKSGETRCNYEIASDVEHSRHPSKNKKTKSSNEDQTTDTRRNNNKKSHTRTSSSNKGNTKSNSASSKSNSKCNDNMKTDQSKKSKRSVKPSSSGSVSSGKKSNSISKQKNDTRKDSSTHTMKRSQNDYDSEKGNSSLSERSSPSVNHSVLANHNERPSSSRYSSRNITHEENQLSLLNTTTTCTTSSSTDDIIFKFGLTTSNDHGTYQETSNCLGCSDGDSYDLFLSELTKTMSSKKKSSGTGPSSRTSSASLIEPLSPSGHSASRVYCSAIVHRECTPSPETSPSPFEAKESHL